MVVTVYHMRQELSRDERDAITHSSIPDWEARMEDGTYTALLAAARASAATKAFREGKYEAVATIEGSLDDAWELTNNHGVRIECIPHLPDDLRLGYSDSEIAKLLDDTMYDDFDKMTADPKFFHTVLSSWSRAPHPRIHMHASRMVQGTFGGDFGRKSSEVGDIFVEDGAAHVVASIGFDKLEDLPLHRQVTLDELREIAGKYDLDKTDAVMVMERDRLNGYANEPWSKKRIAHQRGLRDADRWANSMRTGFTDPRENAVCWYSQETAEIAIEGRVADEFEDRAYGD